MVARVVPHPNALRTLAKKAGYSWQELHEETGIPKSTLLDWAAGNRSIRHREREILARVIGCSPHDLAPQYNMLKLQLEDISLGWGKDMLIKRRELLHLLSIAGGTLLASDIDWDHIEASLTKLSCIDDALVNDLEKIDNHYWSLFIAASTKSSVLDGVLGQVKMQVQFLKETQTTQTHQRLCALASSMSQLAGEVFFDLHDYDAAQACYVFAASSAKEAKAFDLWASALIRHSYLSIFEQRYEEVVPLLKDAELLAQRGDPSLPTRYWAAATHAEAEAGRGNLHACQNALGRAQGVYELRGTSPAWTRFDGSRLPALQGACYVRLKQPSLAEPVLQEALQQNTKVGRRRGMVLSDLALSALQQTDIERSCGYAEGVVTLVSHSSSGFLRNNLFKIQQQLAPFADAKAVKTLEKHIASLA